ncbi:dynamin family protein [Parvimonas micra]|uniref:dynamin family protein n=1 Tax=Parvimonas micra TaxID=33033 RepID=UPI00241D7D62|nr:dynamin family protein [Parvimonas micra]
MKKIIDVNIIATMSAGKSTLVNSLLGKKILPSKQGACTAIVTKIEDNKDDVFKAIVLDKNNEEIVRYSNINYEDMKYLNNSNKVSEVDIKGNISFINCESITLVLIDTPGPDNAMDERHAEITHKALSSSSKMLVLFVMNGGTLNNNFQKSFLQDIAKSMSVGGKQSKERFIFVVNKIDEYIVDDDIEKDVLEETGEFLKQLGIENPNIFLVSAEIALGIRRLKNATSDEKQGLLDEYRYKINKLNSNVQFHLEKYAKLPASSQQIIDKELEAAIKNDDKIEQALIHSGIRSLEEAIKNYCFRFE